MSIRKFFKIKYDGFLSKYDLNNKINTFLTSENLRIFAWLFILTRVYHIYQTVNYIINSIENKRKISPRNSFHS